MSAGTFRTDDGTTVVFSQAITLWSEAAFGILRTAAGSYRTVVNYKDLALEVQETTGVSTRVLMMHWIGQVLEQVAMASVARSEPPLTSLCIHQDGTIGAGYAKEMRLRGVSAPDDLEKAASQDRLACYQRYAGDLPADGGRAELTPQVEARRERQRRLRVLPPAPVCQSCFMEIPRTGICGNCG